MFVGFSGLVACLAWGLVCILFVSFVVCLFVLDLVGLSCCGMCTCDLDVFTVLVVFCVGNCCIGC